MHITITTAGISRCRPELLELRNVLVDGGEFVQREHGSTIEAIETHGNEHAVVAVLQRNGPVSKPWFCGYAILTGERAASIDVDAIKFKREITHCMDHSAAMAFHGEEYDGSIVATVFGVHYRAGEVTGEAVLADAHDLADAVLAAANARAAA